MDSVAPRDPETAPAPTADHATVHSTAFAGALTDAISTPGTATNTAAQAQLAAVPVTAAPASVTPVVTVTSTAVPAAAAPPLATQISPPIVALTTAAAGEHVLTLSVTPDNLGPVTVRAHISATGMHVELFAPNDLGRDALRVIMPDLRRDLAGTGMSANLQLSPDNQPGSNQPGSNGAGNGSGLGANQGGGNQPGSRNESRATTGAPRTAMPTIEATSSHPSPSRQHASSVDVMA
ncbi:MAG: flagellar hook-length control protein FliK [Lacisediminihabitans sp.]